MAPPISSVSTESSASTSRASLYNNPAVREAARVRDAQSYQQQATENTRTAKAQADDARRRLQVAITEEQQADQRVRDAKAEEQQAIRASQQQLRGSTINVVA